MKRWISGALVAVSAAGALPARAELAPQCYAKQEVDRYRLLRRLSLDLRNQLPSYEEYLALDAEEDVPEAWIDGWLASDEARMAMRRFHEDLLWPNVQGVQFTEVNGRLDGKNEIHSVIGSQRRKTFRKGTGTETCGNYEQTQWNPDGSPVTKVAQKPDGTTYLQDGWTWVNPFWDPANPIKVCAFDAQANAVGIKGPCGTTASQSDQLCGCGENLRYCYGEGVEGGIWEDLREQLGRLIDDSTVGGRAYSEIITTKRIWVNGRLRFWKKYLANVVTYNKTWNALSPGDPDPGSDPKFTDTAWVEDTRTGMHAGIQTLGAYTLRFQTNRGRANRFRTIFTSQYFVPAGGEDTEGCSTDTSDLTQRCTCRSCHQVLEPLAAYFAPVVEAGSSMLDFGATPVELTQCTSGKPGIQYGPLCNRLYVTDPAQYNAGTLIPYQFADLGDALHQTVAANAAAGPAGFATSILDDGFFHASAVRNLWRYLMGREMDLDPSSPSSEIELLGALTDELRAHDDFRALVKRLVALPQYRRVR